MVLCLCRTTSAQTRSPVSPPPHFGLTDSYRPGGALGLDLHVPSADNGKVCPAAMDMVVIGAGSACSLTRQRQGPWSADARSDHAWKWRSVLVRVPPRLPECRSAIRLRYAGLPSGCNMNWYFVIFFVLVVSCVKRPGFSNEEPESLYRCDSPWISSYHIQNSFQVVNQFILT